MIKKFTNSNEQISLIFGGVILLAIYLTSYYNYLLFHTLAEFFSIIISSSIFLLFWNSQRWVNNSYFLLIAITFFFVGGLDLVHTMAYKGMGIFEGYSTNLATQLWIASCYLESLSFCLAPLLIGKNLRGRVIFGSYGVITSLLLGTIFYGPVFPICYVDGVGLTPFKIVSEYIISAIFLVSIILTWRKRHVFDQPIMRLNGKTSSVQKSDFQTRVQLIGFEVLLRWRHPRQGLLVAKQFISEAEEMGLMATIDKWVLRTACTQAKLWQINENSALQIAVNMSASMLQQKNLVSFVAETLRETQLTKGTLCLEISESIASKDIEVKATALQRLTHLLNIQITLDNFGSGNSSLSYLKDLPIHILKIDTSFVANIGQSSKDEAIVTTIIDLGHTLGLSIIAEGVETVAQLDFLSVHHCDIIQGNLLSPPISATEITTFLEKVSVKNVTP